MTNFIQFHYVECRNLAAVGNMPVRIQLDRSPTTAVIGNNGAGKSSILLDAVCFALYGKPFRNVTKSQIVNQRNGKGLLVTIEFTRGNNRIKIVRGHKPGIFEIYINNKLVDQASKTRDYQQYLETELLGIEYNSFTQIVMIGRANYVPFLALPAALKRQFVERVLGLDVFATMADLHKQSASNHAILVQEHKAELQRIGEQLKAQKRIVEHIRVSNQESEGSRRAGVGAQIAAIDTKLDTLKADRQQTINELAAIDIPAIKADLDSNTARKDKAAGLRSAIAHNISQADRSVQFMHSNTACPTCHQSIDEQFKADYIAQQEAKLDQFRKSEQELADMVASLTNSIGTANEQIQQARQLMQHAKSINQQIAQLESDKIELTTQLNTVIINDDKLDSAVAEEQSLKDCLSQKYQDCNSAMELSNYYQFITLCLKDSGIKSILISEYLPVINSIINQNITSLGLFATVALDNQFREEIKIRGFDPMLYNQLSEGEKLRLDMAVMMAWRDIARYKANMSCNLLVMDEIFDSSVDAEGTAAFADLLKVVAGLNVFVITHTPEKLADSFRSFIRLEKKDGFTTLAEQGNY